MGRFQSIFTEIEMERKLFCGSCKKIALIVRDGRISKGVVVYCRPCYQILSIRTKKSDFIPDFLKGFGS